MRRYLSYLLLCGAALVGVGASTAPAILSMDADLSYAGGQTMYFRAAEWDESTQNGNYTGPDGRPLEYDEALSKQPIEYIADTMRSRLDAFGVSGYSVETQGADMVAVKLRTTGDSETLYGYLQRYLAFSGGDYELDASNTSESGYAYNELWADIIDGQTARIVDIEQGTYNVPTVVVPLKDKEGYKDAITDLVKYCKDNTVEADEEAGTDARACYVVVWANRAEGDTYDLAQRDANMSAKIINLGNPENALYYESDDTDQEHPYLRLIPGSEATSAGNDYDPSKTKEAYQAALNLMLTINAGTFSYSELSTGGQTSKFAVSYLYSDNRNASVEGLVANGDWNREVSLSKTLIALGVGVLILAGILAWFERSFAAMEVAVAAITAFASFGTFVAFGAQFNIAALIALGAVTLVGLFGAIYHAAKVKEELYKGRTLKKANAEASRKSLLPIIDMGVIAIILGVAIYALAGDLASKAGVMLALGGFFSIIVNLIFGRIASWLLCNDNDAATRFPAFLGVKKERVPDLLKEEKQTYFGPFASSDFSKGKKISLIAGALFLLAGIGATIGWGVATNGNGFFNSASYEAAAPTLRIDVRSNDSSTISLSSLSETSKLLDPTYDPESNAIPQDIFHIYKINDKFLADYVTDLTLSKTAKSVYVGEGTGGITYYWRYYEATLGKNYDALLKAITDDTATLSFSKWTGASYAPLAGDRLADLAVDIIGYSGGGSTTDTYSGAYSDQVVVSFSSVTPADLTPYLWQVCLGLGVGFAVTLLYMMIRYRLSRGLVATLLVAGSSFIAMSFFILTRIATLPVVSLGAIFVAVAGMGFALYILGAEKEIFRESKEKDKNAEFRANCLKEATSRQAFVVYLFAILGFFLALSFFAFGPNTYSMPYLASILGTLFALMLVLTAMAPLAGSLGKQLGKIHFARPKKKAKKGGQLLRKKSSAEPEESIFIGIND